MADPTPPAPSSPPAAPAPPTRSPPPAPRSGDLADQGAVVRDSVRARSWSLRGWAKVPGTIELDRLSVAGDLAVAGAVTVDHCESEGHVTIEGATNGAGPWTISGEHRFGGPVSVQALRGSGRVDVKGPLTAAQGIEGSGSLDVDGDVNAAGFAWSGSTTVSGELRAGSIRITVESPSKAAALRAEQIRVERRGGRFSREPPVREGLGSRRRSGIARGAARSTSGPTG